MGQALSHLLLSRAARFPRRNVKRSSARNTKAVVRLPFRRGKRVSVFAAFESSGFFAWVSTEETFSRREFHSCFVRKVVALLSPWPLPTSIVVLDNAKIHMYPDFKAVVHQCNSRLLFISPYCPQLNSIEPGFSLLKKWIQRYASLIFPLYPNYVLSIAMILCIKQRTSVFHHCGYNPQSLHDQGFTDLMCSDI